MAFANPGALPPHMPRAEVAFTRALAAIIYSFGGQSTFRPLAIPCDPLRTVFVPMTNLVPYFSNPAFAVERPEKLGSAGQVTIT
jgi:hypothetical protein